MTSSNLEKKILDKIKLEKIQPKSRLFFVFKNVTYWILFVLFLMLGAVSFSSILYKLTGNYQVIQNFMSDKFSFFEFISFVMPYFWIVIFILFFLFSIFNYKKTKGFYKHQTYVIVSLSCLAVFIFGYLMYVLGVGQRAEEISQKYIPFYNKYEEIQELRKKIFIDKLKSLGVTKNLLDKSPSLKKKIEDKFERSVLGKIYLYNKPNICLREDFICLEKEIFFEDKKGCGCREVYFNIKVE